jgi:putative peptidoglycan lipid II flippase
MFVAQPGWGYVRPSNCWYCGRRDVSGLLGLMQLMPAWDDGHMLERFCAWGLLVVAGVIAYFGMLLLLGFRLRDFNRKSLINRN